MSDTHIDEILGASGSEGVRLVTFFQPFYNLRTGGLQGLEALARLRYPDGRTESPADFFAAADEAGRLNQIDLRVLEDALEHMTEWRGSSAHRDLILSVNLSGDLLGHRDVVQTIGRALERHHIAPDRVLIDITTDTFRRLQADGGAGVERLRRLQARELTFCLDSFTADDLDILPAAAGVPVDIIKVHPRELGAGSAGSSPLATIAQAVEEAGLPAVAAGIENREQLALVRELRFEWAQGYLLGEPTEGREALRAAAAEIPED